MGGSVGVCVCVWVAAVNSFPHACVRITHAVTSHG